MQNVLNQPTWPEKVNKLAEFSQEAKVYTKEYLKLMLNALVNRIKLILNTDTKISSISNSTAILIRPTIASVSNISEDYELSENFKVKLDVLRLEGNHFSILENPILIETLNKHHPNN